MPLRDRIGNLVHHNTIRELINILCLDGIEESVCLFMVDSFQFRVAGQIGILFLPKLLHPTTKIGRFLSDPFQKLFKGSFLFPFLLILCPVSFG